jgi:P27 family predicted phage terminase small subunit
MRGRKPEPTALKILRGNPGKRPLPKEEPKLPLASADCPRHLTGEARKKWVEKAPILVHQGVLTVGDLDIFERYCQLWSRIRKLERRIARMGYEAGRKMGLVIDLRDSEKEFRALAVELGQTPSARSRVKAAPSGVPDETEGFLFGDRRSG